MDYSIASLMVWTETVKYIKINVAHAPNCLYNEKLFKTKFSVRHLNLMCRQHDWYSTYCQLRSN